MTSPDPHSHDVTALQIALTAAYAEAAASIDIAALIAAIEAGNAAAIETALAIKDGLHQPLLDHLSHGVLDALTAAVLASMTGFSAAYGSRVQIDPATIAVVRADMLLTIIMPLATAAAATSLSVASNQVRLPASEVAAMVIAHFALSLGQSKSVMAFQAALTETQRTITVSGKGRQGMPVEPAKAKQIMLRHQTSLNAFQRSSLQALMSSGVDALTITRSVSRQARALTNHRMKSGAQQAIVRAARQGEYRAFVQGRQNRSLPSSSRRFWTTAKDERVRHPHAMIPGMNSDGVDVGETFITPLGPVLYPPLEVNCRCRVVVRWPDLPACTGRFGDQGHTAATLLPSAYDNTRIK